MTLTKEIQQTICKAEIQKGNLVAENFNYFFTGELDVISVNKTGYASEFEVKVSRADFKADAKKRKWHFFDIVFTPKYIPNYFTYVCPANMIQEADLKPYMGLIYYNDGELITIRKPKLLHKEKPNPIALLSKLCRVNNWKQYFGAQKLTLLNREILAKNDERLNGQFKEIVSNINKKRTPKL